MSARRQSRPTRFDGVKIAAVALLALAGVGTLPAAAQDVVGVALGPDGEPLSGITVVLHSVGASGGGMAGTDTTGAGGEFSFVLPPGDSAVYFAAVRYDGALYVGPAIQAGTDLIGDYVLRVEPAAEVGAVGAALSSATAPPPGPMDSNGTSGDTGALLIVGLLAVAAAAVFLFTAPRYRMRRTREAVMEVARIENRLADAGESDLSAEERERLEERRDQLKEQLAPRA